jgi:hypothetical protein
MTDLGCLDTYRSATRRYAMALQIELHELSLADQIAIRPIRDAVNVISLRAAFHAGP